MALSDILKRLKDAAEAGGTLASYGAKKFSEWGQRNFPHPTKNESFSHYMKRGMGALGDIGVQEAKGFAQPMTLGLYKPAPASTELGRTAQSVGKIGGNIFAFNKAFELASPFVGNWNRLGRVAATHVGSSAVAAATEPGNVHERLQTLVSSLKSPVNFAFSAAFPISSVKPVEPVRKSTIKPIVKTTPKQTNLSSVDDIVNKLDLSLKNANKNVTGVAQEVSPLKKTYLASLDELGRYGKTGKRIANTIRNTREQSEIYSGKLKALLRDKLQKLNEQELNTFADVAEGKMKPVSVNQEEALRLWKAIANKVHQDASGVGIKMGKIEQYFPHFTLQDIKEGGKPGLKRGAQRRVSWEFSRVAEDVPYRKDPYVLYQYLDDMGRRIMEAKHFGTNDKLLYKAVQKIAKEGGDAERAQRIIDQILGKQMYDPTKTMSARIRQLQAFKLGPTSTLTNLTQNLSTAQRTGWKNTLKAIAEAVKDPETSIRRAIEVGEIDPHTGMKMIGELKDLSPVGRWLKLVGFSRSEAFNRQIASAAGESYTRKLIQMAEQGSDEAMRELKRLGFNSLKEADPLIGAKRISEMTQFNTQTGELPYWAQTSLGRIVSQFKGFAYKQSKFMANELSRVSEEAIKYGNFKPLATTLTTFGIAAPIVGEIIADIKALIRNKKRDEHGVKRYLSDVAAATSLGLLDNIPALLGKYGAGGTLSALGGPTASDIYKATTMMEDLGGDEYDKRKAVRKALRFIPGGLGSTLSNTLVPNKHIDNIWGGVNVGLGDKEKKVYLKLKQSNPEQAESYKQNAKLRDKKPSLLEKIFGGDKKVQSVVQSKDYGSLSEEGFSDLYSKATSIVKGYEKSKVLIENDPTLDPATKQEKLLALEEKYRAYQGVLNDMQKYPDKVFKAELKTYSHSHGAIKVKQRAEWAAEKIKSAKDDKERRKLIQQMIDAGVLTTGSKGTIAYLKKLGINIYSYGSYTKDGKTLGGRKKVRLKKMPKGSQLKIQVAKAPKVTMTKIKFPSVKSTQVKIKPTKISSPKGAKILAKAGKLNKKYKVKKIKLAKVKGL